MVTYCDKADTLNKEDLGGMSTTGDVILYLALSILDEFLSILTTNADVLALAVDNDVGSERSADLLEHFL